MSDDVTIGKSILPNYNKKTDKKTLFLLETNSKYPEKRFFVCFKSPYIESDVFSVKGFYLHELDSSFAKINSSDFDKFENQLKKVFENFEQTNLIKEHQFTIFSLFEITPYIY